MLRSTSEEDQLDQPESPKDFTVTIESSEKETSEKLPAMALPVNTGLTQIMNTFYIGPWQMTNPLLFFSFLRKQQNSIPNSSDRLSWNIKNYQPSERVKTMQGHVEKLTRKNTTHVGLNPVPLLEIIADEICDKTDRGEVYPARSLKK